MKKITPVSRAYEKLKYAVDSFKLDLKDKVCADFGSNIGGFVQVILEQNPKKIYSVETSKNQLHFVLKGDDRVSVLDRTNVLNVKLPEKCDFISIDVGWTPQRLVIPNAVKNLKKGGKIVSLIKPHYELNKKDVSDEEIKKVLSDVKKDISRYVKVLGIVESPIVGLKGKNKEYLMLCENI